MGPERGSSVTEHLARSLLQMAIFGNLLRLVLWWSYGKISLIFSFYVCLEIR